MDEATSPPLHRWLSFCRMFMLFHPRVGADSYALHLHQREGARPGWNAIHRAKGSDIAVKYMWIGAEEGRLTDKKPNVPDDEIFNIYEDDLPPLEQSQAWRQTQSMAALVAKQKEIPEERVARIMDRIRAAAACPLRGVDPWVAERMQRGIDTMKTVARAKEKSLQAFTAPCRAAVLDCLNFEITMTQASNVIAGLLEQYAGTPSPLDDTPRVDRIRASAEHLIDHATALGHDRMLMNLTSFYQATYLGLLYGNAALLLLRQTAQLLPEGAEQRRLFDGKAFYVDEYMAHNLAPCLMHPIDFMPCGPAEFFHAQRFGIVDPGGMYPGAGDQGRGPVDPESRWQKIEEHSAQAEAVDIIATVDGENSPLHDAEAQRLMMFLLARQLGQDMSAAAHKA